MQMKLLRTRARIRKLAICNEPTAAKLASTHGGDVETAIAAHQSEWSTAEVEFGPPSSRGSPLFVLVGGEHRNTAHDFHHTSLGHIGDAYHTLRSLGYPRENIIVVAQLQDTLEHAQARAAEDSAWAGVIDGIRERCGLLLEEGGAQHDFRDVNPRTVWDILSSHGLGDSLFLMVYSHGDQHPISGSVQDFTDPDLNEWYFHMPYASPAGQLDIYEAVHTTPWSPYHLYSQQLRACIQTRLRSCPWSPIICLLNFCRSGGFLHTLEHGSETLQTRKWPVMLMSSSQSSRDALVGGPVSYTHLTLPTKRIV
eukprot:TRINITY_DN55704_c0_g1_i2.p1 TRINITY_DN55704_c0_g1~~TRINITY_DN55704_c0_g1_i2.p1  ORF type:complete len:310 (+),score=56.95 TRINITY_DN55704_c0_g1_i2:120-1049(+)